MTIRSSERAIFSAVFFLGLFIASPATAMEQAQVDKIARAAYEQPKGKDSLLEGEMILVASSGKNKEERKLQMYRQDWNGRYRNMTKFTAPNDIKGTGFLTWSFIDKDDAQWIYLPALKQLRKISLATKHQAFVGTDFSYDDMRERKFDEDSFEFVKEAKMDNADCVVLKATPKPESKSQYEYIELYIRKDINFIIGIRYFKKAALYKLYQAGDIRNIDGIWVAHKSEIKNLQERTKTQVNVIKATINKGFSDDLFSERNLEK